MNVQPGDFAEMVYCQVPQAVGLIVHVEHRSPNRPGLEGGDCVWRCTAVSGAKSRQAFCLPGEPCDIPDAWLRRITESELLSAQESEEPQQPSRRAASLP